MMQSIIITFCQMVAVTLVILSLTVFQTNQNVLHSWIRVEDGRILACKSERRMIRNRLMVVNEYDAGGARYLGEDTLPIPMLGIRMGQLKRHPSPGDQVAVYVNPASHQISTIDPDRLARLGTFGIAAAAICLLVASLAGTSAT